MPKSIHLSILYDGIRLQKIAQTSQVKFYVKTWRHDMQQASPKSGQQVPSHILSKVKIGNPQVKFQNLR